MGDNRRHCPDQALRWSTAGGRLTVNDQPFILKGINVRERLSSRIALPSEVILISLNLAIWLDVAVVWDREP